MIQHHKYCVDKASISELLPSGYKIKHVPRAADRRGGDVGIIYKSSIELHIISSSRGTDFVTFEYMGFNAVTNTVGSYSLCIAVVYRPTPSQNILKKIALFQRDPKNLLFKVAKHLLKGTNEAFYL